MTSMHPDEVRAIAAEAGRAAAVEMLLMLGVNASDEASIIKMQKDFAHVRLWRESIDTFKSTAATQTLKTAIGIIVTGLIGYVVLLLAGRGH